MILSRRSLLGGIGAGLALHAPRLMAAGGGVRRFRVLRDGSDIGTQSVDVRAGADGALQVAVDVDLRIKILGVTAYRYTMRNRETWKDGRLIAMDSRTDDDGDNDYVKAKAAGEMLEIDGSVFQGTAPGDAVSTTYWSKAFLERRIWINSQTGVPIEVTVADLGAGRIDAPSGPIATERWSVKGDNLDIILHYAAAEWVSVEFDAGGEPAIYIPTELGPDFAPLWAASL